MARDTKPATSEAGKKRQQPRAKGAPTRRNPASSTNSGRYTKPTPRSLRRSGRWHGATVLILLVVGVLLVVLNYLTVLPGAVSTWYLVAGIVCLLVGFAMATRYR